ncbi:helix-turn-helix domain-containing protein [Streptomyces griseoviridis]|jgi:transcriptional regulator GlxA family with amidase domain|uniref:AraC family transcriptional regulator n=3 Tax=Streptomyces TaxID=1883 RepID=A0A918GML4_STRGD|nr:MULTISPECIES: helix-turn-helix domain-containing protein [Streptomyces]MDP9686029.1 transcriptional regulator GlxA family with amidase domain [Streptomyces griseoviridis]GGS46928.1 AraC family transcriptional regulator [Streptomyces niveoruber]GGS78890.1 AraC family transcriptional regulator [Streptomyces griseoviridis]GGU16311.1 AraC family transcriptional regulator [Streptomyces daghestanicus]GHI35316.1 AraC family transcriptional regulator [Streptomyces daghestanicus]
MHTIAVLALDRVIPFDLSTPIEVFTRTRLPDGRPGYQIRVCAERPEVDAGSFALRAPWGLDGLTGADTVIVPGTSAPADPLPGPVRDALRAAAEDGTRIASICSGTFVLAAAGLLDGLRATTHWVAAGLLAARYPEVEVDPDVLYVDNGQILTSAGAAAGLDLCLHLIRRDYGSAVAADAARLSVMPLEREGGQAQFIVHDYAPRPQGSVLEPLLAWLQENLGRDLTLGDIAAQAGTSTRTLIRRFREQTGTTPLQWLHRARVRQAQHLLETTRHPVERIAAQVGFGSPTAFRERFKRTTGVSPHAYRRTFASPPAA